MAILLIFVIVALQLFMFGHLENYFPFERPGPVPLHKGKYPVTSNIQTLSSLTRKRYNRER